VTSHDSLQPGLAPGEEKGNPACFFLCRNALLSLLDPLYLPHVILAVNELKRSLTKGRANVDRTAQGLGGIVVLIADQLATLLDARRRLFILDHTWARSCLLNASRSQQSLDVELAKISVSLRRKIIESIADRTSVKYGLKDSKQM